MAMSDGRKQYVADLFLERGSAEQAGRLVDLRRQASKALDGMMEIYEEVTGVDVGASDTEAEDLMDIDDRVATGWAKTGRAAVRRGKSRRGWDRRPA